MTIWSSLVYSKFLIDDPQVLIHCPQFLINDLQFSIHDEKNLAIISEGLHIILVKHKHAVGKKWPGMVITWPSISCYFFGVG